MSESANWQASLLEQRMAWGIAACCIILVVLASARPEWLDFSGPKKKQIATLAPSEPAKPAPAKHATVHPRKTQVQKAQKPTHVSPPAKAPTVHAIDKPKPAAKTEQIAGGFYVQLGAFKEYPRALGLADQIKRKGWHSIISPTKGGLHAVLVGPKQTRNEAEKLLKSIQGRIKNKGFIVHR